MKNYQTILGALKKGDVTEFGTVIEKRKYRGNIKVVFDSGETVIQSYYFPVIETR